MNLAHTFQSARWLWRWWPWLNQLGPQQLRADAMAGLMGMVLALPQGVAFAALAGLPVEYGVYTCIVPTIVAALAGSSWHVTSGPTNTISLAILAMLSPIAKPGSPEFIQLVLVATLMVGAMQWLIGAFRLGAMANFISPVALFGFTSGAAWLIATHALPNLLGWGAVDMAALVTPLDSSALLWDHVNAAAVGVSLVTLGSALLSKKWWPRAPHMLVGLILGTLWSMGWSLVQPDTLPLQLVGQVPSPWPAFGLPQIDTHNVSELVGVAFALTLVALGQTISIAKVLADRSGQSLDPNREFIGQGLSNMVGACFSAYVSCGSLNRSLPNYDAGARTPLAAVLSAAFMLLLVGLSAQALAQIPMAAINGLLILVAWNLMGWDQWLQLWRMHRRDFAIAAVTALATITLRMEVAILLGTLLSLFAFLLRTAKPAMRTMGFDQSREPRRFVVIEPQTQALPECPQLKLLRMEGEVYFGATPHVAENLRQLRQAPAAPSHLLVMSKSMNFIDYAGAQLWQRELKERRAMGGDLYFHRPRSEVLALWQRIGFLQELGQDNIFEDKRSAIAAIVPKLNGVTCAQCRARVFEECSQRPGHGDA